MTTTKNNEHKKLNFSSEREQNQACLNSAEHEKNQGRKVLNVPNLRFPEFQGEWEEKRLSEIADLFKGNGISKEQLTDTGEPCILYGELYTKYKSEVISDIFSKTDIDTRKLVKSKANDVIIPCSGETAVDIATARCVPYDNILLGGDLNIIRLYDCDGSFMSYQLNGKRKYDLAKVAQGVSVVHLYGDHLKGVRTYNPCLEEQKKIAKLLSLLDERIATQNKIIDKLQSLIKGVGKQLFMDNQNWRTVKIGELLRIGNGKDYKHLSIGKIPVYGTGGQMLLVNDYLYDGESVCIGRKGTIDTPMFLKGKFWTVDTLFYTYDFKDVLPKFCYYLFLQINWKLYNEGTGVPSLSKSTIENIKVKIPSLEQQHKICSILDCYEHKTNNEEQILELYHSEKQYLLRQMFI